MRKCLSDSGDVTVDDDNAMIENDDGTKDNGCDVDNATGQYTHKRF